MTITLEDYAIANGIDRTCQVLSDETVEMQQQTQSALLSRADWLSAWPERASRSIPLSYAVVYPPCATLEDALMQSRSVLAQCPKGGVLIEEHEGSRITYAQAWVTSIRNERLGVSNRFHYSLLAVSPDIATPSPLALMNINEVANLYSINGLVGGTETDLDSLVTTDVQVGFQADVFVSIGGLDQLATFRLFEGTDAINTDPDAGAVIVRPVDYDGSTNAKVWKRLDA